jgi:hypothetical protein
MMKNQNDNPSSSTHQLNKWVENIINSSKQFVSSQLGAFAQMIRTVSIGFWRMLVGLAQITFLMFYMIILIFPQLVIYSLAIIILWPIAKLEEFSFKVLDLVAGSLSNAIRSLRSLTNNIMKSIDTINRDLKDFSFVPKDRNEDS